MGPTRKRASMETSKEGPTTQKVAKSGGDQSDPNGINGDASGLADVSSVKDIVVQCTDLENRYQIKEEQEECDISQNSNQQFVRRSFISSVKPHEPHKDQIWILKDEENQNFTPETEKKTKLYTCFCGKSYTCTSHLNRHRKIHVSEDQLSGGHYNSQIIEAKTIERCFTCHCGKQYTRKSNLKRHQSNCNEQIQVESTDSAITYGTVEDQQEKLKPYVCDCGKSYTCSSHLYRHQRSHLESKIETEKRFICECGKSYSCRSHLYRHQRTHTEEKVLLGRKVVEEPENLETRLKPYVCFCGKSYTCSSHLKRHQKSHQVVNLSLRKNQVVEDTAMEKRYKCECGRSYTCTSHLYRHQRTHKQLNFTVESNDLDHDSDGDFEDCRQKPYKCECGKSFILSFSLQLHKKIHCQWKHSADCGPPGQ